MPDRVTSVKGYIESLSKERQQIISVVRKSILSVLPKGYEETLNWGMISYEVPLTICPNTYNKKPLMYAALASQKNYCSLYLTPIYMSEENRINFEQDFALSGKKLQAGKSCVRFTQLEQLPLSVIEKYIAKYSVNEFVEYVQNLKNKELL